MDAEDGGLMPAKTREGGLRPKTWKEPEDGRRVLRSPAPSRSLSLEHRTCPSTASLGVALG